MKYTINLSILSFLLFSLIACSDSSDQKSSANTKVYTGDFSGSPIELSITILDDSTVKGISKHRGIESKLSGKRMPIDKGYAFRLKELGTSRFEGVYDFELDTNLQLIFGSWQLGDTSGGREVVLYTLKPQN